MPDDQTIMERNEQLIAQWMAQSGCVTLRGLISVFPHEPVEKMLVMFSAIIGQQIAAAYAADELRVHKVRSMCRDAFTKGIRETPIPKYADLRQSQRETATIGNAPIRS